ncbi:hypothetical protein ACFSKW_43885 [Nonomuraea mangrovi]|uniref:Zinc transporter ZupT n=1 Tax=Nonomuraea mangrovi TaxID=2316207 RepID=A0ABW4TAK6_9ACTN
MLLPSGASALALALHHTPRPDLSAPAFPAVSPVGWPSGWPPPDALLPGWLTSAGLGTWTAVLLVSLSTLAGAWLARRNARKITVWLAVASALMLITALIELLPDAWREASDTNTPLWLLGLATVFGFAVITYFTRKGCGHSHESARRGKHAPGLHRRVTRVVGAALFGGVGTAAALTVHRVVEGATLALAASAVVVAALMVHSASEGLALTALLDLGRQRLAPWLLASCLSPALGVALATLAPLPPAVVPLLLGMITGVLLRTAVVGLKLAGNANGGRLSRRHLILASAAVLATTVLLLSAQTVLEDGSPSAADIPAAAPAAASRTVTNAQAGGMEEAEGPAEPDSLTGDGGGPSPAPPTDLHSGEPVLSRDQLRQAVASGRLSLAELLRRTDATAVATPIGWLLQVMPGCSADRIGTLLELGEIAADASMGELTNRQRRYLLRTFAPAPDPSESAE